MRFLPIGEHRVTVLDAMMHDPRGTQKVAQTLMGLKPQHIIVERTAREWQAMGGDAYQAELLKLLVNTEANILWRVVAQAARQVKAEVAVLHRDAPPVPPEGIKQLQKLIKREGFHPRGDPKVDLMTLHEHFVSRVPPLWQYIQGRREASAARLQAAIETRPRDAVVVLPWPDCDDICDRIQARQ